MVIAAVAPFFAAAIFAACLCYTFSLRLAAAASLRFWFAVFVVSIMIRFPLVDGLLMLASPPMSQLLSLADFAVWEAEGLAALISGRHSSASLVSGRAGWVSCFLAAQSWQENGKFSMSKISAYSFVTENFQNKKPEILWNLIFPLRVKNCEFDYDNLTRPPNEKEFWLTKMMPKQVEWNHCSHTSQAIISIVSGCLQVQNNSRGAAGSTRAKS